LTQFGRNVPKILQAIERETRFRRKPIGPLGSFVSMNENVPGGGKKWAIAISAVIGGALGTFTVDNFSDQKILNGIIQNFVSFSIFFNFSIFFLQSDRWYGCVFGIEGIQNKKVDDV
jgi:hypothetical protein